jgi:hypothetical protein
MPYKPSPIPFPDFRYTLDIQTMLRKLEQATQQLTGCREHFSHNDTIICSLFVTCTLKFVLMSHIKEALNRTLKTNTKT